MKNLAAFSTIAAAADPGFGCFGGSPFDIREPFVRRNLSYITLDMMHGGTTTTALSLFLGLAQVRLSTPFITTVVVPTSSVVRTSGAGCVVVRTSGEGCELVNRSVEESGATRPGYRGERGRVPWALDATARVEDEVDVHMEAKRLKKAAKEKRIAHRLRTLQQLLPGLDASLLISKSPRLLGVDSQRLKRIIPARLAVMQSLLGPGVDAQRLVRLNPDLLLYDVKKTLGPRIVFLQTLFPESPKLLMRAPALLYHDAEMYLLPKMAELGLLLPGVDVLRLVRREPTILSLDVARNIKPKLESLAEMLPGQNVTSMVGRVPRLLTSDVSGMAQKVSSLRWLLGPSADLNKIVHRKPDLLISNVETTVAAKFRQLQDLFPEGDVVSMVERDATVLFYDFDKSINVKVDCWRERVSNVTELDCLIQAYPVLLSYSLDTSVSRLDFLIQTNGTEMTATKLRQVVQTARRDWDATYGDTYRKFLERKVEGPSVLRLWPGLYFDSDTKDAGSGGNRMEGDGLKVQIQDDGSVKTSGPTATALKATVAHLKSLEKQYGTNIKEAQLRFSSALRYGKYGSHPTEMDMIMYDIKSFDQQVRKLATGKRMKRFKELLPGLNPDKLFTEYPHVVMMDLKKVEERVQGLRQLLVGADVSGAVSIAPHLLLSDVQTCLRPRMTRLVVAMSVKQLQGVLDADKVKAMVVRCPELLLSDVRNVVVPSLQYMLRCTTDHDELGKRLFRDPSLLTVGAGPLARLQYTLEQHRNGTANISLGTLDASVAHVGDTNDASGDSEGEVHGTGTYEPDASRLLPPVVVPQILKCQLRDFVERNPGYVSFLAQRQGLAEAGSAVSAEGIHRGGQQHQQQHQQHQHQQSEDSLLTDHGFDQSGQVVFWERSVGARLSEMFRPVDSPYAREKMKEAGGKGPDGQRGEPLSELDLLVGDVLYFNHRMGVLFRSKIQVGMPQTVDLRQEVAKLEEDVEWGSRQIRRLLGLGSWTEKGVPESSEARSSKAELEKEPASDSDGSSSSAWSAATDQEQPQKEKEKHHSKRTWVMETFKSLWDNNASGRSGEAGVPALDKAVVEGGGSSLETAQELERFLGEVSSYEGRLEGLLDMPVNADEEDALADDA